MLQSYFFFVFSAFEKAKTRVCGNLELSVCERCKQDIKVCISCAVWSKVLKSWKKGIFHSYFLHLGTGLKVYRLYCQLFPSFINSFLSCTVMIAAQLSTLDCALYWMMKWNNRDLK